MEKNFPSCCYAKIACRQQTTQPIKKLPNDPRTDAQAIIWFLKHFQVGKHDLSFARKNRSYLYYSLGFQFTVQYTQRILTAFPSSCLLEIQLKSFPLKLNENYRTTKILSIFFTTAHYQITFWKALKVVMHRPGSLICLVSQTG